MKLQLQQVVFMTQKSQIMSCNQATCCCCERLPERFMAAKPYCRITPELQGLPAVAPLLDSSAAGLPTRPPHAPHAAAAEHMDIVHTAMNNLNSSACPAHQNTALSVLREAMSHAQHDVWTEMMDWQASRRVGALCKATSMKQ
jgi:hypothetical protein